jgi:hypothetical protein
VPHYPDRRPLPARTPRLDRARAIPRGQILQIAVSRFKSCFQPGSLQTSKDGSFLTSGEVRKVAIGGKLGLGEIAERRKLSRLLDPITDLCKAALENSEKHPSYADREAQKVMNTAPQLVANLSASKPGVEILSQAKDEIAVTLMHCAVAYGNKTEKWKPCIAFLEEALKYASSEEVKSRTQKNLSTVRNNYGLYGDLKPISSAPPLYTINFSGTTLYGSTDYDPASGSYLSTYYFVLAAIPIFPISRYRVIPTGEGYCFLGKAPLRTFDKCHIAIVLGLIFGMLLSMQ